MDLSMKKLALIAPLLALVVLTSCQSARSRQDGPISAFSFLATANAQLGENVGGVITERADLRSWQTLPGSWHGARTSPSTYADGAEQWIALGATHIGGCCGTGPEHIAELKRRFK